MVKRFKHVLVAIALSGTVGVAGLAAAQVAGTAATGMSESTSSPAAGGAAAGETSGYGIDAQADPVPPGPTAGGATIGSGLGTGGTVGAAAAPGATGSGIEGMAGAIGGVPDEPLGESVIETDANLAPSPTLEASRTAMPGALDQFGTGFGSGTGHGVLDLSMLNLGPTSTPAGGLTAALREMVDARERQITAELNRAALAAAGRVAPAG